VSFGGEISDVLYVTSAKLRKLTDPFAGALFALDVGVNLTLPYFKE
jgi:sugar lactone lactonase YvrE